MVSEIADNIPYEFVSIRHIGILDGEKEITSGEHIEIWAGSLENYSFEENNDITTVTIETDSPEDYIDYFTGVWPKALKTLKKIAEG